jgi:hypothetical protein
VKNIINTSELTNRVGESGAVRVVCKLVLSIFRLFNEIKVSEKFMLMQPENLHPFKKIIKKNAKSLVMNEIIICALKSDHPL